VRRPEGAIDFFRSVQTGLLSSGERVTLDDLRWFAVSRSLVRPRPLGQVLDAIGFVQADPIRAPARAQDLTLRHRVSGYRAGDLERRYAALGIEEDVFINYGFVSSTVHALMHPRERPPADARARTRRQKVLAFVRERGEVHPREVDAHFAHGTVVNYWGGSSSATTRLLDDMHYRGWLRVTRRARGIRLYAVRGPAEAVQDLSSRDRLDRLVDVVVHKYAPLPAPSLSSVVRRLRYAVPQWRGQIQGALDRARKRLRHERVDGTDWYWPADESPAAGGAHDQVRLLAPFDPVVWDRRRFEQFWGWPYRFEAYTPVAKRRFGYYALPMLWRNQVIGWGNLSVVEGQLRAQFGYVASRPPSEPTFARERDAELHRVSRFLGLDPSAAE
jgi:uncharacterized protein YcaQ